jgi:hypothetical protein
VAKGSEVAVEGVLGFVRNERRKHRIDREVIEVEVAVFVSGEVEPPACHRKSNIHAGKGTDARPATARDE